MAFPKKRIPALSLLTVAFLVWFFRRFIPRATVTWNMPQYSISQSTNNLSASWQQSEEAEPMNGEEGAKNEQAIASMPFQSGSLKAIGEPYTKTLILPRTSVEDVMWIGESFGGDPNFKQAVYTVDDVNSKLQTPANKGHEVMVYLSYIIDHYDNLSDVNIFMHSHRFGWHNNELLDNDAVQMMSRLSSERVQREGFMNMRCHWSPGCPDWMHPGTVDEDINKQEEIQLPKSWSELFPFDPVPQVLAQPCCGQFAISRDRIRSLPLVKYVFYRDWLLRTSLSDYLSGRVWEYMWQFVFTGKNVVCPKEHICYCDGFGVCFGGEVEYESFYAKVKERQNLENELKDWQDMDMAWRSRSGQENEEPARPEVGKDIELKGRIEGLLAWCEERKQQAKEHGDVAMNRAREAGREWTDGDGF